MGANISSLKLLSSNHPRWPGLIIQAILNLPNPLIGQLRRADLTLEAGGCRVINESFLPRELLFTEDRGGWKAALWAPAPRIDVILLVSTLSELLISLISLWSTEQQQQMLLALISPSAFPPHLNDSYTIFSTLNPLHHLFTVCCSELHL